MLSAVVLVKNEEKNIQECLKTLSFCDEIIVVDDYSVDGALGDVKSYSEKLKVFPRHLNNDFSAQRNFGLEKAKGEWILFVDADERVTKELSKEIKLKTRHSGDERSEDSRINKSRFWTSLSTSSSRPRGQNDGNQVVGYYLTRQDYFLGKWLKYGEVGNIKLLRLAKKGAGKWKGNVHEEWKITGKIEKLDKPLLHYPHQTVGEFLQEINFYSTLRAQELFDQGKKTNFWQILVYPMGKFFQNYLVRLGLLDGMQGLILAIIMSFHSFLVRSKLYFLCHSRSNNDKFDL